MPRRSPWRSTRAVSTPCRRSSAMAQSPMGLAGKAETKRVAWPNRASDTATLASPPPKLASRAPLWMKRWKPGLLSRSMSSPNETTVAMCGLRGAAHSGAPGPGSRRRGHRDGAHRHRLGGLVQAQGQHLAALRRGAIAGVDRGLHRRRTEQGLLVRAVVARADGVGAREGGAQAVALRAVAVGEVAGHQPADGGALVAVEGLLAGGLDHVQVDVGEVGVP